MEKQVEKTNYLLKNIREVLPVFLKYIPEKSEKWKKLDHAFSMELEKRLDVMGQAESAEFSATIYDMIAHLRKGNVQVYRMLFYIVGTLSEVLNYLTEDEVKSVGKRSVYSLLSKLDYGFYHFVGEMAVLRGLMSTGYYRLLAVEAKVPDCKKTIDFKLKNANSGDVHLVEVYNIFPDEKKVEEDDESIKNFIENRIIKKRKEKVTKELFDLILVFWGPASVLRIYSGFLKRNEMWMPNVACYGYTTIVNQDGVRFENRFRNLNTLFD